MYQHRRIQTNSCLLSWPIHSALDPWLESGRRSYALAPPSSERLQLTDRPGSSLTPATAFFYLRASIIVTSGPSPKTNELPSPLLPLDQWIPKVTADVCLEEAESGPEARRRYAPGFPSRVFSGRVKRITAFSCFTASFFLLDPSSRIVKAPIRTYTTTLLYLLVVNLPKVPLVQRSSGIGHRASGHLQSLHFPRPPMPPPSIFAGPTSRVNVRAWFLSASTSINNANANANANAMHTLTVLTLTVTLIWSVTDYSDSDSNSDMPHLFPIPSPGELWAPPCVILHSPKSPLFLHPTWISHLSRTSLQLSCHSFYFYVTTKTKAAALPTTIITILDLPQLTSCPITAVSENRVASTWSPAATNSLPHLLWQFPLHHPKGHPKGQGLPTAASRKL
ncbi:hypothetical protein G7046_g9156 [Stylonectria norvegica]|nr:hypothetical protein G7046_g9156 [Stylonectria norvegica]